MEQKKFYAVRRRANKADEALAKKMLVSLAEIDREAMIRFYFEGQSPEHIETGLGLTAGYVAELKRSVKARFFEERNAGRASEDRSIPTVQFTERRGSRPSPVR